MSAHLRCPRCGGVCDWVGDCQDCGWNVPWAAWREIVEDELWPRRPQ